MAKRPIPRVWLYGGIALLGVIAWSMTAPEPAAKSTSGTAKPIARKSTKKSNYTDEDRKASFPPLVSVSVQNSFRPLVARRSSGLEGMAAPGGVPPAFAGGDPNWICTGTAEVDGVRMALLENKSNGEGVFLRQGDRFRTSVVSAVIEDGLVLVGPNGEVRTVRARSENEEPEIELTPLDVDPALTGPISGVGVRPEAGQGNDRTEAPAAEAAPQPPAMEIDDER